MDETKCESCGLPFTPKQVRSKFCYTDECQAAAALDRCRRFRERHPEAGAIASKKRRARVGNTPWPAKRANGLRVHEYKSTTPCVDCKTVYPAECMDFDHTGDNKVNNVGTMVAHGWSWEKIEAEIAKCDLVCANCHRIRTRKRRTNDRDRLQVVAEDHES